jgi:hypothetical protein
LPLCPPQFAGIQHGFSSEGGIDSKGQKGQVERNLLNMRDNTAVVCDHATAMCHYVDKDEKLITYSCIEQLSNFLYNVRQEPDPDDRSQQHWWLGDGGKKKPGSPGVRGTYPDYGPCDHNCSLQVKYNNLATFSSRLWDILPVVNGPIDEMSGLPEHTAAQLKFFDVLWAVSRPPVPPSCLRRSPCSTLNAQRSPAQVDPEREADKSDPEGGDDETGNINTVTYKPKAQFLHKQDTLFLCDFNASFLLQDHDWAVCVGTGVDGEECDDPDVGGYQADGRCKPGCEDLGREREQVANISVCCTFDLHMSPGLGINPDHDRAETWARSQLGEHSLGCHFGMWDLLFGGNKVAFWVGRARMMYACITLTTLRLMGELLDLWASWGTASAPYLS